MKTVICKNCGKEHQVVFKYKTGNYCSLDCKFESTGVKIMASKDPSIKTECIFLNGVNDGKYKALSCNSKSIPLHVYACTLKHGPKPEAKMHASHLCGNMSCGNPDHVKWETVKDNMKRKNDHGTLQEKENNSFAIYSKETYEKLYKELRKRGGKYGEIRKIAKELNVSNENAYYHWGIIKKGG